MKYVFDKERGEVVAKPEPLPDTLIMPLPDPALDALREHLNFIEKCRRQILGTDT